MLRSTEAFDVLLNTSVERLNNAPDYFVPEPQLDGIARSNLEDIADQLGEQQLEELVGTRDITELIAVRGLLLFGCPFGEKLKCLPWVQSPDIPPGSLHASTLREYLNTARNLGFALDRLGHDSLPDEIGGLMVKGPERQAFLAHCYFEDFPESHTRSMYELANHTPDLSYSLVEDTKLTILASNLVFA